MSFVFYDIETTGTSQHFDQILQFAAIRTDDELQELEQFEVRSRLLPHVIPAPGALHVTGVTIQQALDPSRPSYYEMVCAIRDRLGGWCPSVFIGFNSLRFDEEFLRHAFYQCLHPPYLTNTAGSGRADAIHIVRGVAALHPGLLSVPVSEEGKRIFKLDRLAPANGFEHLNAHDALADVEATIHLCRIVRDGAPDLWDRFMRFTRKAAVQEFVTENRAFVFFEFFGASHAANLVVPVGRGSTNGNLVYCLDLRCDLDELRDLDDEALAKRLARSPRPVRKLKLNGSPLLVSLDEAGPELLDAEVPEVWAERANCVVADRQLCDRLVWAMEDGTEQFEASQHVEQQLYDGFWSDADGWLIRQFHEVSWEQRVEIVGRLSDARLRRLARRLIFFERPDLLTAEQRAAMQAEVTRRLLGEGVGPWLTVEKAREELRALLERVGEAHKDRFVGYERFLERCATDATA